MQAMKMADRNAKQLQNGKVTSETDAVNKVEARPHSRSFQDSHQNCHRCREKHKATECRDRETVSQLWNQRAHCLSLSQRQEEPALSPTASNPTVPNTNSVEEETGEGDTYTMFPLRSKRYAPIYVTMQVNQSPITMEVNMGATL